MRQGLILALLLILFGVGVGFRHDTLPFPPDAPFSDATISRYPDALYFQRSLREDHTLPLWNPHLMGGQPFAANTGTKTFYPLTWLLLVLPVTLHLNLMILFHLWLGGMGMGVWARLQGISENLSWVAILGYSFAPKLIAHAGAGHLDLLIAMAWLPWLLVSLHHLILSPQKRKFIVMTAGCGTLIFIGAVQLLPYLFGLAGIYALYQLRGQSILNVRFLIVAAILGIGLAGMQWLPLVELRDNLSRGDIRPEDAALASLQPGQLVGLLIGDHGGDQETLTYVGLALLTLAILGFILRPRQNLLWWGVILVAAFYGLGENFFLWRLVVDLFPPMLLFRVPSRAWFLVAFLLPYLAAWGAQNLLENPPDSARARLSIVGVIGFGLSCAIGSTLILQETEIKMTALIALFFLPLVALWIALVIFRQVDARFAVPLLLALILADGLWIGRTLMEGRPQSEWLNPNPPALIADLARTGARIYTPDYAIPQQDTAYWGIARLDGVDPFQMANFIEWSGEMTGIPREGYSTTVPAIVVLEEDEESHIYKNAPMNPRQLGAWGVDWVITQYLIQIEGLDLIQEENGLYFYQNELGWNGDIILDWESPNQVRQTINSDLGEIRTVVKAPTWKTLEGNSVGRDPWSLPPLSQTYVYRPWGIQAGLALSGLSLLVSLVLVGWRRHG